MEEESSSKVGGGEETEEITIGKRLQLARKARGLSLAESAQATRINADTLQALEESNRQALPAPAFTRGFVKIYASHLGLDPEQALRHYIQEEKHPKSSPPPAKIDVRDIMGELEMAKSPRKVSGGCFLLLILLLTGAVLTYWGYGKYFRGAQLSSTLSLSTSPKIEEPSPAPEGAADPGRTPPPNRSTPPDSSKPGESFALDRPAAQDSSGPEISPAHEPPPPREAPLPDREPKAREPETQGVEKTVINSPTIETSAPVKEGTEGSESELRVIEGDDDSSPQPLSAESPAQQEESTPETEIGAGGNHSLVEREGESEEDSSILSHRLVADFTEDTWLRIQIDDQPARQLFFQAGSSQTWEARQRLFLRVGNAGGVELNYNGNPLPPLGASGRVVNVSFP